VVAAHYKKDNLLNCWTGSSDISGYHPEFHEACYQKHTNPPHNDPYLRLYRMVAAHYKKDDLLNCGTSSPDISGYHAEFHGVSRSLLSEAYQSSSQRSIPRTVNSGSSTLQKDDLLNCWTSSPDISGYHPEFHEGHGTVGAGQGRGMACVNYGTTWHGHGML